MQDPAVWQQAPNGSSQVIVAVTEEGGVAWSGGHVGQAAEEERDQRELTEIAGGCLKKTDGAGIDLCCVCATALDRSTKKHSVKLGELSE